MKMGEVYCSKYPQSAWSSRCSSETIGQAVYAADHPLFPVFSTQVQLYSARRTAPTRLYFQPKGGRIPCIMERCDPCQNIWKLFGKRFNPLDSGKHA